MLKILLKKSFKELAHTYFKNKKTGGKLDKKGLIGKIILFVGLYGLLLVSCYGTATLLGEPLFKAELYWLYFSLFGLMSVFVGMGLNMFMAKSFLYEASDNEQLLAMPIDTRDIVIARSVILFVNNLIYTSIVYIPAVIFYVLYTKNYVVLFFAVFTLFLINLFASSLANILGLLVSLISKLFNNNSIISTIFSVIFFGLYYYVYFNFQKYLNIILADYEKFEEAIRGYLYIFYCLGQGQLGNVLSLLVFGLFSITIYGIIFYFLNKSFISIVTTSVSGKTRKFDTKEIKTRKVMNSLIHREFKRFITNSTYTLNCGFGIIVMLVLTVALFVMKNEVINYVSQVAYELGDIYEILPVIIVSLITSIICTDALCVPAISLEGKNYWLIRSLPVDTYDVLLAKRTLQVRLHVIPVVLLAMVSTFVFGLTGNIQVFVVVLSVIILSLSSNIHLMIGLLFGNLDWTSEAVPVKQNFGVLVAILSGYVLALIMVIGSYYAKKYIGIDYYMFGVLILFVSLNKLIERWIKTQGVKRFEELG